MASVIDFFECVKTKAIESTVRTAPAVERGVLLFTQLSAMQSATLTARLRHAHERLQAEIRVEGGTFSVEAKGMAEILRIDNGQPPRCLDAGLQSASRVSEKALEVVRAELEQFLVEERLA